MSHEAGAKHDRLPLQELAKAADSLVEVGPYWIGSDAQNGTSIAASSPLEDLDGKEDIRMAASTRGPQSAQVAIRPRRRQDRHRTAMMC
jgi:hypothetical protein